MAAIFSFLILSQVRRHGSEAESHKEHSGENRTLISLFVNEISAINENSKWPPSGHLGFLINMNFRKDQLDIKWILCVKFQNSETSGFRGDEGTT